MSQHSQHQTWAAWPGWSTISAQHETSFTLWFTGLPGTGKTTLAKLAKKALLTRGYKVEIIDAHSLSYWLKHELQIEEESKDDRSHTPSYEVFITYICSLLARNGIITLAVSVSPYREARLHAREQIHNFIEAYVHCPEEIRSNRLQQLKLTSNIPTSLYQPPEQAELNINTGLEPSERSTLRIIDYLEQSGFVAPLWQEQSGEEELTNVIARLQALGYLD